MRVLSLAGLACAVAFTAGCNTQMRSDATPAGDGCGAERIGWVIGQQYSEALADRARRESGAGQYRLVEPDRPYTMDFHADRLNIEVDRAGTVIAARCG